MEHYIGHQQALIKDNLVIAVLVFNEHDPVLMYETFQKFDYDHAIDLCKVHLSPGLGDSWDGKKFHPRPFPSWNLDENNHWQAPVIKPNEDYVWNEEKKDWEENTLDTVEKENTNIEIKNTMTTGGTPING
jgi:hypothetical protein